jgi:hypothetical protein
MLFRTRAAPKARLRNTAGTKREVYVRRPRLGVMVLVTVVAGTVAGVAAADPANAPGSVPVTVTCGNTTYQAIANGNGAWTPAHDLNSNSILIPVAFGVETDVFTDPSGTAHTSTSPARARARQHRRGRRCSTAATTWRSARSQMVLASSPTAP